jgi:hypothetical protein
LRWHKIDITGSGRQGGHGKTKLETGSEVEVRVPL